MRLVLNEELCSQHGQCVGAAPELLGFGDDGKLRILVEPIPKDLEEAARDACDLCPTQSLSLTDD
jgi:ferredoxin